MTTLKNLIGLGNVKQLVSELEAYINIKKHRENFNLKNEPLVLHMIFKGNPGTGKTTVARLLGQILLQLQVLPQGHLVEIERADLVGEYIGHTAQKTREQIKRAMGGILFVDEAYSLARGGEKDFGKEAVDTMVKAMEDHKDEFVLILAGYTAPMEEFLRLNPGLKSRFPIQLNFPDYTIKQLLEISQLMLAEREYKLTARATARLREILEQRFLYGTEDFSNARLVRNILELAIRRHALRLKYVTSPTKDQLQTLESCDILQSQATQAEGI
ncbi:MAG: AAA family ATPase [Firmicutes bacterium]|nr:AAA family ATPase [Bacillota bacterium]